MIHRKKFKSSNKVDLTTARDIDPCSEEVQLRDIKWGLHCIYFCYMCRKLLEKIMWHSTAARVSGAFQIRAVSR
jgi:hypothetical protein